MSSQAEAIDLRPTPEPEPEPSDKQDATGDQKEAEPAISELVGDFGWYHLVVALACFTRFACAALMTNSGPLLAPELQFNCQLPAKYADSIADKPANQSLDVYLQNRCLVPLTDNSTYKCVYFDYNKTDFGRTLTDSYDLVCDRAFLRSSFQSAITVGVAAASLLWGSISDQHGRRFAVRLAFVWSLKFNILSYWTSSFAYFTLYRALCAFGDIGISQSLMTMVGELYGNRLRGPALTIVYTGWSVGVMAMAWLVPWLADYQRVMLFLTCVHLATAPLLMFVTESARWLLVRGQRAAARKELLRIRRLRLTRQSGLSDAEQQQDFEAKFNLLSSKYPTHDTDDTNQVKPAESKLQKVKQTLRLLGSTFSHLEHFYRNKELAFTMTLVIWITFHSELYYMFFIMVNSDVGASLKTNYAVGFLMELSSMFLAATMSSTMRRRPSLALTCFAIAFFSALMAWIHDNSYMASVLLNITKLAVSNLTSLVCIVQTELFPTSLRQTGQGFAFALGSGGAIIAPFMRQELASLIGMTGVMLVVATMATLLTLSIYLLRETKDVDLADNVGDIERVASKRLEPTGGPSAS